MKGKALVGTWALALVLVGWDSISTGKTLPKPRRLFGVNAAWSLLAVLSLSAPVAPVAVAMSVGLDVMLAITVFGNQGAKNTALPKTGGSQEQKLKTATSAFSSYTSPIIGAGTALLSF